MSRLKREFQARYVIMVIMVNYIPRFNFVYELQCFQGFLRRKKKNAQRGLVLNLVKISKDFLIFISILLRTAETRFDSEPVSNFSIKIFFWRSLRATPAR